MPAPTRYRNRQGAGAPPSLLVRMGQDSPATSNGAHDSLFPQSPQAGLGTELGFQPSMGPAPHAEEQLRVPVLLPTQQVFKTLPTNATAANLMDILLAEHRYEMGGSNDVFIWEVAHSVKRPIRLIENIKAIIDTWRRDSGSYFFETSTSECRHDLNSLASLTPRRDILKSPPELRNLLVHYSVPRPKAVIPGPWNLGTLDVTNGTIVVSERSPTDNEVKFTKTLQLSTIDVYEQVDDLNGPCKFTIALRSVLPRSYFIDVSDTIIYISMESTTDHSLLRNLVFTMRSTAIEHPHGLILTPTSLNTASVTPRPFSEKRSVIPEKLAVVPNTSSFDRDPRIAPTGLLGEQYEERTRQMVHRHPSPPTLGKPGFDPTALGPTQIGFQRGLIQNVRKTVPAPRK